MYEVIPEDQAAAIVSDSDTVCIGGGGAGHAVPDELIKSLGRRFQQSGKPEGLTILHPCGLGDSDVLGLNHIAFPDMLKRVIGGFYGNAPKMVTLAQENRYEGYNFPQGVLSHLMRATAAGETGLLTKTGLHTFVDPRYEGGKVNEGTTEDLVELVTIGQEEFLFYRTIPIDVAFIRGTSVDNKGNLTMESEVGTFAMLSIAQAAKVNGGTVIAQVSEVKDRSAPAVQVKVPGPFIDYVVRVPDQPMTYITQHDPSFILRDAPGGDGLLPLQGIKKIIARRGALELFPGAFVNVGYGIADGVPIVAHHEDYLDRVTFLIEQGSMGGVPTTGLNFGAMHHPSAILDDGYQFDFFHGGGLDLAFLGFAQVDLHGNVNSSRFGNRFTGCGGFIDISQHSKKVVFCGSFAVKGRCEFQNGEVRVTEKGKYKKFVSQVDQITFNGRFALKNNQEVLYLTERGVFELVEEGLLLREIAPGVDLQGDILDMMDFSPVIHPELRPMDQKLFDDDLFDLHQQVMSPS